MSNSNGMPGVVVGPRHRSYATFGANDQELPVRHGWSQYWVGSMGVLLAVLSSVMVACAPGNVPPGASDAPSTGSGPAAVAPATRPAVAAPAPPESNPRVGLQVGERAPAFIVKTLEGGPLASSELLAQDKPFILYFFATW